MWMAQAPLGAIFPAFLWYNDCINIEVAGVTPYLLLRCGMNVMPAPDSCLRGGREDAILSFFGPEAQGRLRFELRDH
jgi:hypothetical protein